MQGNNLKTKKKLREKVFTVEQILDSEPKPFGPRARKFQKGCQNYIQHVQRKSLSKKKHFHEIIFQ